MEEVTMRRFKSLFIDRAAIRVPGLQVQSFAVHRHLAEHASVTAHRHAWTQAIVYLSGAGEQALGGRKARVGPGTLVLIPPGLPHAFQRRSERVPLSVLIDFRMQGARRNLPVARTLNRSELAQLRAHLAQLRQLHSVERAARHWDGAVSVLQLLLMLLRAGGWIARAIPPARTAANPGLRSLLTTVAQRDSLGEVIRQSGYHRDHLNRLVKAETGLTLGQYRAQQRLTRAKGLLVRGVQVAHVGAAIGLPDQSYFARWFRRQTGQTPSAWRRQQS